MGYVELDMTEIRQTLRKTQKKNISPSTFIAGLDREHPVRRMLSLIEAPANLQSVDLVLAGVEFLKPHFQDMATAEIEYLREIDSAFLSKLTLGAEFLRSSINSNELDYHTHKGDAPFRGVTDEYPLYTLLGQVGQNIDRLNNDATKSIAYLIAVCRQLNSMPRVGRDYKSATHSALAAMRIIYERSKGSILPPPDEDVKVFAQRLSIQLESEPDDLHLLAIERVVRFLVDGEGGHLRRPQVSLNDIELSDEPGRNTIHVERARSFVKSLQSIGLSQDEICDGPENVLVTRAPVADASPGASITQVVLRRKNIDLAIQRANQCLRNDYCNLADAEISQVLQALDSNRARIARQLQSQIQPLDLEIEAVALAYIALLCGQPLKVVRTLRIISSYKSEKLEEGKFTLIYALDEGLLYLEALRPNGDPKYSGISKIAALPTNSFITLPIGRYIHQLIENLPACQRSLKHSAPHEPVDAFAQKIGKLNSAALRLFSKIKMPAERLHDRLRSGALFARVFDTSGRLSVASLIATKHHRLSDTGLHYLCISTELLHQTYVTTIDTLMTHAGIRQDTPPISPPPPDAEYEKPLHLGSPLHPKKDDLQQWVAILQKNIRSSRCKVLRQNYWFELHNAHALYIDFMLRFALGLRDVDMPLPSWDRINLYRRTVLVDDKGDIAGTGSRVLPINSIVIEQLMEWRAYLERNSLELITLGDEINTILNGPVVQFLAHHDRKIKLVHPTDASIREYRRKVLGSFDLPVNCNRHYLYSALNELILGGYLTEISSDTPLRTGENQSKKTLELIDVLFGHHHRGREPGGLFSMLSSAFVCEGLREPLDKVMASLGFRVCRDLY